MTELTDTTLAVAIAAILASVALAKAFTFGRFVISVEQYRIVPPTMSRFVAVAVVGAEIAVSMGLLAPHWRRVSAELGIVLLSTLMAAMGRVLLDGRRGVECGCSLRTGGSPVSAASIARNGGLVLVLMFVAMLAVPGSSLGSQVAANAGAAGLGIALLYLSLEGIAALPAVPKRSKAP